MRFERLRLCGFKSFVEPVEIEIRPGLTGVVGPNGCGKSNLVEGLRWLMGANSAKAMRASGMDEVIFAGTAQGRPARSWAEVTLEIDNSSRRAPAQFNDADQLTVTRRVVRRADGSVSQYSINGKEVRARDVQMLFADASTGSSSPALVRQGQIAELIAAKPTERRRFLEEAAGVTGLAARRHEAQLRLNAAADNLERLDDVIGELDVQSEQLARQARKAQKYRALTDEIKAATRGLAIAKVRDSYKVHETLSAQVSERRGAVADAVEDAARKDRLATEGHEALEGLRNAERDASLAMTKAEASLKAYETNAAMHKRAAEERERSLSRLSADEKREAELIDEADATITAAEGKVQHLKSLISEEGSTRDTLEAAARAADEAAQKAETAFEEAQRRSAEQAAEAKAASQARIGAEQRVANLREERSRLSEKRAGLPQIDQGALDLAQEQADTARQLQSEADELVALRTKEVERTRLAADAAGEAFREAKEAASLLANERKVLTPLIPKTVLGSDGQRTALTALETPEDLRAAVAAALGDALHAALSGDGNHVWSGEQPAGLPALPEGTIMLGSKVDAPPELAARFSQIGLVDDQPSAQQLAALRPGQTLLNRRGQLWRWDGYRRLGPEAQHLEELLAATSRLRELAREEAEVEARLAQSQLDAGVAKRIHEEAKAQLDQARSAVSESVRAERLAEQHLTRLTRDSDASRLRRESLDEQLETNAANLKAAEAQLARTAEIALAPPADETILAKAREERDEARRKAGRARAQAAEHRRLSTERRDHLRREEGTAKAWRDRRAAAAARIDQLKEQRLVLEDEIANQPAPQEDREKEESLELAVFEATSRWEKVRAELSERQKAQTEADRLRRETEARASSAREALAELSAELKAAKAKLDDVLEEAEVSAENIGALMVATGEKVSVQEAGRRLEKLERERERLGAVNLLAADEAVQVNERLETLRSEREDCEAASTQLRTAVNAINREGRQRLLAAFETVNGHFRQLFTTLFRGGEAELKFVDSDDPLTAGLEIFACPPGKKLQSLSLMSGGEQALTATALIFAAFKTNPAPICVLDEVDAPLDDANVERFCDLLGLMAESSTTRFLVVTHHPLTMSRMDRLFGVTMMEQGVSRLFSIDLEAARRLAA
jgi:chromosome segregation protein